MAIYVNGVKVAGRGVSGKSPYQVALAEGYTGSEAEFNEQLAAIGVAVAGFNELTNQVNSAKTEIDNAVQQASQTTEELLRTIATAKQDLEEQIEQTRRDLELAVLDASNEIDEKVAEALASIPDSENLVTKVYLAEQNYATNNYVADNYATKSYVQQQTSAIVTDIYVISNQSPDTGYSGTEAQKRQKLLWIDTNTTAGGLKYYNGTKWAHVPVAWT